MQNRARALTSMAPNAQRLQHRLSSYIFGNPDDEEVLAPTPERGRHDTLKAFENPGSSSASGGRPAILTGRSASIWGSQEPSIPGANLRYRSALPADIEYNGMLGEGSRAAIASPFLVGGDADERNGRLNFSASLSQIRSAALAQETAKLGSSEPSGLASGRGSKRQGNEKLDIWVEGQSSYYTNDGIDGRRKGRASVLYAGSDMVVAPGVIIGVLYQRDWITESATALGQNRDGAGWMAGPYVGMRLTKNIYFDARYAWGTAINHVDPIGAYTDTFSTSRNLASARLTGDWTHGAWRFRPSADLTYYTETQKSYVNQIGIDIPDTRISLGRITFGPEVGYRMQLPQQMVLEPYVGLKGVWDFAKSKDVSASGVALAPDVLTGRLEVGASLKTAGGVSFRAVGAYDGLGTSNYRAWQGQGFVIVPIK
jgi:outer membrane autotransporter protein